MNIWIIEDDSGYRRNLRISLKLEDTIVVSRVFPSCIELFDVFAKEPRPDVILMDLGLPGMSGIEAIRLLSDLAPDIVVLALTVFGEKEKVEKALKAGAAGYLLKESAGPEIIESIKAGFAEGSVRSLSSIYEKLQVSSQTGAVAKALRAGVI